MFFLLTHGGGIMAGVAVFVTVIRLTLFIDGKTSEGARSIRLADLFALVLLTQLGLAFGDRLQMFLFLQSQGDANPIVTIILCSLCWWNAVRLCNRQSAKAIPLRLLLQLILFPAAALAAVGLGLLTISLSFHAFSAFAYGAELGSRRVTIYCCYFGFFATVATLVGVLVRLIFAGSERVGVFRHGERFKVLS